MMNRVTNSILVFGVAALVSAMLTTAAVSNAAFIQNKGVSACTAVAGGTSYLREASNGLYNAGTSSIEVLCDVTTDNMRPASSVTLLVATGWDYSSTQVMNYSACRRYATMAGGACGPSASNGPASATGWFQIPIDRTQWMLSQSGDWAYLDVVLPINSGGINYLSGFQIYYP